MASEWWRCTTYITNNISSSANKYNNNHQTPISNIIIHLPGHPVPVSKKMIMWRGEHIMTQLKFGGVQRCENYFFNANKTQTKIKEEVFQI